MEIYFAQIREDSRVERSILQHKPASKIAVIGSGGCTAFSILSDEVQHVYAIDLNPAQCALISLKAAAIQILDREAFLAFIGESASDTRLAVYNEIKKLLPTDAMDFWEARTSAVASGINKCGVTEKFYAFVSRQLLTQVYDKEVWQQLFNCTSLDEQQRLYEKYFTQEHWCNAIIRLLSKTNHLRYFPAFMFAQAQEDDYGKFFLHMFSQELQHKLVRDNYFLSQFLFGCYQETVQEGMPFYLTDAGYRQAKRNLGKLEVISSPIDVFLNEQQGIGAFFLSNLFDWTTPDTRAAICKSMLHAAAGKATLLFRNMLSEPQLPEFFLEKFKADNALSAKLQHLERSMMYRRLTAGELT